MVAVVGIAQGFDVVPRDGLVEHGDFGTGRCRWNPEVGVIPILAIRIVTANCGCARRRVVGVVEAAWRNARVLDDGIGEGHVRCATRRLPGCRCSRIGQTHGHFVNDRSGIVEFGRGRIVAAVFPQQVAACIAQAYLHPGTATFNMAGRQLVATLVDHAGAQHAAGILRQIKRCGATEHVVGRGHADSQCILIDGGIILVIAADDVEHPRRGASKIVAAQIRTGRDHVAGSAGTHRHVAILAARHDATAFAAETTAHVDPARGECRELPFGVGAFQWKVAGQILTLGRCIEGVVTIAAVDLT